MGTRQTFTVILTPVPPGDDFRGRSPIYRLRIFLKVALRAFGLRAVSVVESTGKELPR